MRVKKLVAVVMIGMASHAVSASEKRYHFNIIEQSLNNALVQFAADYGIELIFTADKIRGFKNKALLGEMTVARALEQLLLGSGYTYQFISPGTVTIIPFSGSKEPSTDITPQPTTKKPLTVKVLNPLLILGKESQGSQRHLGDSTYFVSHTKSATKTDTPIREIPQSVHAISSALIKDQANLTVSESLRNVSGVSISHPLLTPSFDLIHIRGFAAEQLLDGYTQYYNVGDRESLINIEQLDVLKGSNALLYSGGSGSPAGGLVNLVTKQPKPDAFYSGGINYGSYQYYQPYFDVNQPINQHILFRITGEYTASESHIDVIETQRYNINPTFILTDNEKTSLTIQGKVSHWEQVDYQGLPTEGTLTGNISIRPETFIGPIDTDPSHADFYAVWGTLEHKINNDWSLSIKSRYAESEFDQKAQIIFGADGVKADVPLLSPST